MLKKIIATARPMYQTIDEDACSYQAVLDGLRVGYEGSVQVQSMDARVQELRCFLGQAKDSLSRHGVQIILADSTPLTLDGLLSKFISCYENLSGCLGEALPPANGSPSQEQGLAILNTWQAQYIYQIYYIRAVSPESRSQEQDERLAQLKINLESVQDQIKGLKEGKLMMKSWSCLNNERLGSYFSIEFGKYWNTTDYILQVLDIFGRDLGNRTASFSITDASRRLALAHQQEVDRIGERSDMAVSSDGGQPYFARPFGDEDPSLAWNNNIRHLEPEVLQKTLQAAQGRVSINCSSEFFGRSVIATSTPRAPEICG